METETSCRKTHSRAPIRLPPMPRRAGEESVFFKIQKTKKVEELQKMKKEEPPQETCTECGGVGNDNTIIGGRVKRPHEEEEEAVSKIRKTEEEKTCTECTEKVDDYAIISGHVVCWDCCTECEVCEKNFVTNDLREPDDEKGVWLCPPCLSPITCKTCKRSLINSMERGEEECDDCKNDLAPGRFLAAVFSEKNQDLEEDSIRDDMIALFDKWWKTVPPEIQRLLPDHCAALDLFFERVLRD